MASVEAKEFGMRRFLAEPFASPNTNSFHGETAPPSPISPFFRNRHTSSYLDAETLLVVVPDPLIALHGVGDPLLVQPEALSALIQQVAHLQVSRGVQLLNTLCKKD